MFRPHPRALPLWLTLVAATPALGLGRPSVASLAFTISTTGVVRARPIETLLPHPLSAEAMHRFFHSIPSRSAPAMVGSTATGQDRPAPDSDESPRDGAQTGHAKGLTHVRHQDTDADAGPKKPGGARTLLERLEQEEKLLVTTMKKGHTAPGLYDLAQIRLAIARQKRKEKKWTDVQFRQYLLRKTAPLLKLNLGRRGRETMSRSGSSYSTLSLRLIDKVMAAVKSTVTNLPNPRSHKDQHGIATFYGGEEIYGTGFGPEFHARNTRSGDMYCMFGQTAAYMRAPLGSWIRVLRNRSGRFVDVRVNDTGPFEDNGILIDLSRGAYKVLGLHDRDPITIRRIKPSEAIPEPLLCRGRGAFNPRRHLLTDHPTLPYTFTAR